LLKHAEQVVRIAPKLVAGARSSARERGKSDIIDAVAIARAALREGLDTLPSPSWPDRSSTCGCSSITASASSRSAPS
jgi:transposase